MKKLSHSPQKIKGKRRKKEALPPNFDIELLGKGKVKASKIFLLGNANAGKSTLFNALTGGDARTGNYCGVTVKSKSGYAYFEGKHYEIIDLPGLYGTVPYSPEEALSVKEILEHQESVFVNVIDCNNIERALNLTLQLIELKLKVVIGLNFCEDAEKRGVKIDEKKLEEELGVSVTKLYKKNLKQNFFKLIKNAKICKSPNYLNKFNLSSIEQKIRIFNPLYSVYNAIRLIENDLDNIYKVKDKENLKEILGTMDNFEQLYIERKRRIDKILSQALVKRSKQPYGSSKFDKFLLNKFLAIPIFLIIILAIFWLAFGIVGDTLSDFTHYLLVDLCGGGLLKLLNLLDPPMYITSFIQNALFGGVGSVLSFLPQVLILFLFLEILEQIGYISRLAWLMDGWLARIGLQGRGIFSMLLGFGCSTTAIPTVTTTPNERARKKTAALIPFMSCSAKLPVYAVIAGAFFGSFSVLIVFMLYLLGILIALLLAIFMQKVKPTVYEQQILEFTPFKIPSFRKVIGMVLENTWQFLARIWSAILIFTSLIWLLDSFTIDFTYITNPSAQTSILKQISSLLAPIFIPLGLGYGAVCALLCGLVAKELIISSIAVINGVAGAAVAQSITTAGSAISFTPASALAFLVFCLLYPPCVSAITQLSRVLSKKQIILYVIMSLALAYGLGALVCLLVNLIVGLGVGAVAWAVFGSVLASLTIIFVCLHFTKSKNCKTCTVCRKNFP